MIDAQDNSLQNSGPVDAQGAMAPMALRAAPDSSVLGDQAAPPAAPPSTDLGANPTGGSMPAMSKAPAQTPSLWRNVLQGALAGLANSGKAKTFAGGLISGAQGGELMAQQQRENEMRQQQINNAAMTQKAQSAYYVAETNKLALQLAQANPSSPEHHAMLAERNQELNDNMVRQGGAAVMTSFDNLHDAQKFALDNNVNGVNGQIGAVTGPDGTTKYGILRYNAQPTSQDTTLTVMGADGKPATQLIPAGSMTYQQVAALRMDSEKKLADAGYEEHKLSMETQSKKEIAQAALTGKFAGSEVIVKTPDGKRTLTTPGRAQELGVDPKDWTKLSGTQSQQLREKVASYDSSEQALATYGQSFKDLSTKLTTKDIQSLQVLTSEPRVAHGLSIAGEVGGGLEALVDSFVGQPLTGYSGKLMQGAMTKDQYDQLSDPGKKMLVDYYNAVIANFATMKERLGTIGRNESLIQAEIHTIPLPYIDRTSARGMFQNKDASMKTGRGALPEIENGR